MEPGIRNNNKEIDMDLKLRNGLRPNKRLGQHFLTDNNTIGKIISISGVTSSDDILEIGPGKGALTIPLAGKVNSIVAVEKDSRMVDYLADILVKKNIENVDVINEDILKTDIKKVFDNKKNKLKVAGNLPYNISSPLLEKLISNKDYISKAFLMFQYEFAGRLAAAPGNREYGAITVMTRYQSSVSKLLEVNRNVFYPRPKVGSIVVEIDMEKPYPVRALNDKIFKVVVKGAFAQRRKTIKNSLKVISGHFSGEQVTKALEECGIDPKRRAETLDMDEFLCLSDTLSKIQLST
ncbi:16S rRNA (adenine(1518)-N(6)/adenine(1519)-N(6))-dimethyltransferase RsmA [Thermodesulfobacteriota bacterium]